MKNLIYVLASWFLSLFSKRQAQKVCVLACKLEGNKQVAEKYGNQKELSRRWR